MTDAELVEIAVLALANNSLRRKGQPPITAMPAATPRVIVEDMRAVIAAVRPHLEAAGVAAERERAAKVAEAFCREHATEGGEVWVLRRLADQLRAEGGPHPA